KSMNALVHSGKNWLQPLLEFRDRLVEGRNLSENRMDKRRNGQAAVREDGTNNGTYEHHYRYEILRDLLVTQREIQIDQPHISLINNQELIAIQVIWNRDGYFDHTVGDLYKRIYNKEISTSNIKSLGDIERRIVKDICEGEPGYYQLIDNLISLQETKTL